MPPAASGPRARALALRWQISPHAIRSASLPAIAAMNGQAEKIAAAVLVWRIAGESAAATLTLEIGEDDLVLPLVVASGRWIVEPDTGLMHADFGEALRLTLRDERLIWARTDLLERTLGLRGGVYDGPSLRP